MNATTIKDVNTKLERLPESLLEEVEKYIDFLTFKHSQDIPQWHKDIVLKRIEENKEPVDAFEMIGSLEADK